MTVFRVRPWFLPTSLAAFLTEVCPDGAADAPSDAGADDGPDGPPDTRSADLGTTECLPCAGASDAADDGPHQRSDQP
ncbi:hypothetical protein ACWD6P_34320 [Streptomyces sp. NPDC002446]